MICGICQYPETDAYYDGTPIHSDCVSQYIAPHFHIMHRTDGGKKPKRLIPKKQRYRSKSEAKKDAIHVGYRGRDIVFMYCECKQKIPEMTQPKLVEGLESDKYDNSSNWIPRY